VLWRERQTVAMKGYDESTYGERWADVYDDWYDDPAEVQDTVRFLAELAGERTNRPLVELGIGTGRLALPLAALGYDVRGIDASEAMVARLRAKAGGTEIPVTVGDMRVVGVPPSPRDQQPEETCGGVFVAYNTFFGLTSEEAQRQCLEHVARTLEPGGWFVVAAFVPDERVADGKGSHVGVRSIDADRVVLSADRYDAADQTIEGQYVDITSAGIVLRPIHIRYLFPAQLDELAAAAGLTLEHRYANWRRDPFDEHSEQHVSLYRCG
jgi:SAM-dependent methyltransferase